MKIFILLSVFAVALASRECGPNSHYNSCGTACPLTCDNYNDPPKACILMCNPGCHCDEGYVKTNDGRCIRPVQCPLNTEQCGENSHYTECGTACPLTCDNYYDPPKACVLMCKSGCQCDEGYVKTREGRCIRAIQCPENSTRQVCGQNERWSSCGSACPLTCDNYANPPKICPLMCFIGCECAPGFVKTNDGRCVRLEECPAQAPVLKTCLDKPDPGMCRAYMPMWYYDVQTEKCHQFVYGGCQGNGNRYATEEECLNHCGDVLSESSPDETCDLPVEQGRCMAYFPRYHFNKRTGECEKFIYGGCGGNKNNFKSLEECQKTCGTQRAGLVCNLPAETGLCKARIPRYHYNESTGKCELFFYGGCGGNGNNFATLEDCHETCA